ncbi:unnamed protein product [Cuscuta campestris]|uniref:Uncharacterized protein n=1 Tax=Cuscuta campestris TaxID=132261 RepID=A0A484LME1_9ASTE|nr:unnamed protein product [Cuscuta campestris]
MRIPGAPPTGKKLFKPYANLLCERSGYYGLPDPNIYERKCTALSSCLQHWKADLCPKPKPKPDIFVYSLDDNLRKCFVAYSLEEDGIISPKYYIYPPSFLAKGYSFTGCSCDGLLHFHDNRLGHVLWNPTTTEYKILPKPFLELPPGLEYARVSFGLWSDPRFEDYKMLYTVKGSLKDEKRHFLGSSYHIDLYSLKTNSWKRIPCTEFGSFSGFACAEVMSSDSQNISGQSYGSGSQPSSSSHSESSSPPATPLIRRPPHQSSSQAGEIVAQEPVPLTQLPGRFNPKVLSWDQWEKRLGSLGYLALDSGPVFKESFRVTKKVLAEVRSVLPPGYKVLSKTTWPNIIEPHIGTQLGFHVASLEGGIIFPLRPLLVEICNKFHILPGQLTPNAHRFLNCFVNICESLNINPSLELFLYMYDVLPGTSNCLGFIYLHSRASSRGFITGLPPSHKKWKKGFVFIEFPPDQFPFTNPEWADRVMNLERIHLEPTKELEDACEKLLKGNPVTGKPYAYGGWVYRLKNLDGGVSATHDAKDDRANSLEDHAEASSPHPAMKGRLVLQQKTYLWQQLNNPDGGPFPTDGGSFRKRSTVDAEVEVDETIGSTDQMPPFNVAGSDDEDPIPRPIGRKKAKSIASGSGGSASFSASPATKSA